MDTGKKKESKELEQERTAGGATSKKFRFKSRNKVHPSNAPASSHQTISEHELSGDEIGLVVPTPQSNVPETGGAKLKSPIRVEDSGTNLRNSPGKTQVPSNQPKMSESKSGMHALKVAPKESGMVAHKSLGPKKKVFNLTESQQRPLASTSKSSEKILSKGILHPDEVPKSTFLIKSKSPTQKEGVTQGQKTKTKRRVRRAHKSKIKLSPFPQEDDDGGIEEAPVPGPSSSFPKSSPTKMASKAENLRPYYREKYRKQLHAKYTWRRFYTMVKGSLLRDKEVAAEERAKRDLEAKLELRRQRISSKEKKKKVKKGCFAKLIDFLDEDENLTSESSSDDAEEQMLKSMSFQQMTLGERRNEIRKADYAVDMPEPAPAAMRNRRESKVITGQQVSAAVRRVRSGGSLNLDIPPEDHPLRAENIETTPNYEIYAKRVRTSLPSGYALPHDDATMRLFDQLVPLLTENETGTEQERIDAAADAFDEFRVAKLYLQKTSGEQPTGRLSDIRFLPGNLEERRGVMTEWEDSRARQDTTLRKRVTYFFKNNIKTMRGRFGEMFILTELWHEPIHQIEMNFGVSAATYFRWLRSVILLNVFYLIFSLSFIVIPERILRGATGFGNLTIMNLFLAEYDQRRTTFFYGAYAYVLPSDISNPFESTALRFIIVITLITLMHSLFIGLKVRTYYRRIIAKVSDSDKTGEINFFALFLSAWDYNLTSETAVRVQHRTIAKDFNRMMDVYEKQLKREKGLNVLSAEEEDNDGNRKWASLILHWSLNLVVFGAAAAFGLLVHTLLSRRTFTEWDYTSVHARMEIEVTSAVVIGLGLNCFSPICSWLTSFETLESVKEKVFVLVFRIGSFYVSIFLVLFIFWISNSRHLTNAQQSGNSCWEDDTGIEIYRLMVFEGITHIFSTLIRYVFYPALKAKWTKRRFEKSVFEVEYFTLNLIFVHTLTGVGTFFFPLLPLLAIARLLFTFYWKKFVLDHFCAYPTYQLHPSQIFAPYVVAFFFSYLTVIFSNSWLISEENPSKTCGPFQAYANATYSSLFHQELHSGAGNLAGYMLSQWFLYFAIIILGGVVYTFRAWTQAYSDTLNLLHDLLRLERLDREFLLRAMYSIPGIEARQWSKPGSDVSGGPGLPRDTVNSGTHFDLFIQQQEALAHLFEENRSGGGPGEGSGSSSSHSTDSGSPASAENDPDAEFPTQRAKRDEAKRRHRHLMLPSKAVRILSQGPRRLTVAGKVYADVVGKALSEMSGEGRGSAAEMNEE